MSAFFIDRPVFAWVVAILILLGGGVATRYLAVEQYPNVAPPRVGINASYPGASPEVAERTVTAVIERELAGIPGLLYFTSSSAEGQVEIGLAFDTGTDTRLATVEVQNRIKRVEERLPESLRRQGISVEQSDESELMFITLDADNPTVDDVQLGDFATTQVRPALLRIPGVGEAEVYSPEYAMRIWPDVEKLTAMGITTGELADAIAVQNQRITLGAIGTLPAPAGTALTAPLMVGEDLDTPQAFGAIALRVNPDGSALRVADVARVELGGNNYDYPSFVDGRYSAAISVKLAPGANALQTAEAIKARMAELAAQFPAGIHYRTAFDTSDFVRLSIVKVGYTLLEAMALVFLVMLAFLRSWRATLIPSLVVPIALAGTCGAMLVLGFSINVLTLFGMVLAIGILVDDAIVVVENVERLMAEKGLSPKEASIEAMEEVTGPVIAIVLVLCAVFIPVGFLGGLSGELYKQFAITISVSVILSGIVALTLTPALCAVMLKPGHGQPLLPFRLFNHGFDRLTRGYTTGVRFFLRRGFAGLLSLAVVCGLTVMLFRTVPGGLVPEEDQGNLLVIWSMPPATSLKGTAVSGVEVERILRADPSVRSVLSFSGFNLLSNAASTSAGAAFVELKDWSERPGAEQDARVLAGGLAGALSGVRNAFALAFNPPAIDGLGTVGGFEMKVLDRAGTGRAAMTEAVNALVAAAAGRPELAGVSTTLQSNVPRYRLDIDRDAAKARGVALNALFEAVQSTFSSLYVNDFSLLGRNYRVNLQSEGEYRQEPGDLSRVFVRASNGEMVPASAMLTLTRVVGSDLAERFNGYPAATINGAAAPGYSSGQALQAMQELAATALPQGFGIAWSGAAYQELAGGNAAALALGFGVIMVFLILAAQYGRWTLPIAVLLAVPFGLFGALLAVWLRGLNNDIYFQVGLITLVGLAAKNAILIVEFAVLERRAGKSASDAALEAARLRFRPIIMTSLAFILGCVPLAISTGAGSGSRVSIGTAVVGGMIAATFLAVFLIPLFYKWFAGKAEVAAEAGDGRPPATAKEAT